MRALRQWAKRGGSVTIAMEPPPGAPRPLDRLLVLEVEQAGRISRVSFDVVEWQGLVSLVHQAQSGDYVG